MMKLHICLTDFYLLSLVKILETKELCKKLDLRGVMTAPGFSVKKKDLLTQIEKTPTPILTQEVP